MQKTKNLLLAGLCLAIFSCSFVHKKEEQPTHHDIQFLNHSFQTVTLPNPSQVRLINKDSTGAKIHSLKEAVTYLSTPEKPVLFATNAGMFHSDHSPVGLYVENGEIVYPLNTDSSRGNFFMMPNGVLHWTDSSFSISTTQEFAHEKYKPTFATQSGPMLVIDGTIHPAFNKTSTSTYIRSGVGVLPNGSLIFCISRKPVNFHTFASLFKDHFKCQNALYLDGSISQYYFRGKNKASSRNFGPILIGY